MTKKMRLTQFQIDQLMEVLNLKPVEYEDFERLQSYYREFDSEVSDISLTNILLWKEKYHFHYMLLDSYLFIVNLESDRIYFSMPIGQYGPGEKVRDVVLRLKKILEALNVPLVIKKADEKFLWLMQESQMAFESTTNRDEDDYIYDFNDMKALSGNRYHKKRNLVNKFEKTSPPYEFKLAHTVEIGLVKSLLDQWCEEKECSSDSNLKYEYEGTLNYLQKSGHIDTPLGLLFIENQLKGFILGELISQDMLLIHIEKAEAILPGIYQMLGYAYYNSFNSDKISFINREQDLGIEGLRKSKLSYHPTRFVKKINMIFK